MEAKGRSRGKKIWAFYMWLPSALTPFQVDSISGGQSGDQLYSVSFHSTNSCPAQTALTFQSPGIFFYLTSLFTCNRSLFTCNCSPGWVTATGRGRSICRVAKCLKEMKHLFWSCWVVFFFYFEPFSALRGNGHTLGDCFLFSPQKMNRIGEVCKSNGLSWLHC